MNRKASLVPQIRIRKRNKHPVRPGQTFVLYWMIAFRRVEFNFALERAVEWSRQLHRPLVILEALRCDYPWASHRLHRFVLQGVESNYARLKGSRVTYFPYLERNHGEGRGLLEALSREACVVVTDEFPAFFLPRMVQAAADRTSVSLESVDSNGLIPLRATDRVYLRAYDFRRFIQASLSSQLNSFPRQYPLRGDPLPELKSLPQEVQRWTPLSQRELSDIAATISALPIDDQVRPIRDSGGSEAAAKRLQGFLEDRFSAYARDRNDPQKEGTSGLSPYLHFGHISAHEIFLRIAEQESWSPSRLAGEATGKRTGWWGMSENAEAFLDQLITWRELGFNMAWQREDYTEYSSLPDWANETLQEHASDEREPVYSQSQFEHAQTHDALWNAAQMQLVREGTIHNYLRMLWGKKILHWTEDPRQALEIMIELNNKYALDGRDPNSYSGIFWVLGRYDRPWGPERPIFGKVRYMTSRNTAKKYSVEDYINKHLRES